MAIINCSKGENQKLLIVNVIGDLTKDEIINVLLKAKLRRKYSHMLWDVSKGSVGKITTDEVVDIAYQAKVYGAHSAGGKTALIANTNCDFGIMRMYEAYAELNSPLTKCEVFHDLQQAMAWFKTDAMLAN